MFRVSYLVSYLKAYGAYGLWWIEHVACLAYLAHLHLTVMNRYTFFENNGCVRTVQKKGERENICAKKISAVVSQAYLRICTAVSQAHLRTTVHKYKVQYAMCINHT